MADKKILIIDDDRQMGAILTKQLTKEGWDVQLAHDGEEGLTRLRDVNPDLVILDIVLPNMDGYEVLRVMKDDKDFNHVPVILLTALGLEEDIQKGINLGATHYLTKPLRIKLLVECIKRSFQ